MRLFLLPLLALPLFPAGIEETLKAAIRPDGIPAVVAMVASADKVIYHGAHGNASLDSLFRIYSMTKPVTSVAAMQLVEQGKLDLDAPVTRYLPELANRKILTGFTRSRRPLLRPARRVPTIRQLLSHTSGYAYTSWDPLLAKYRNPGGYMTAPLVFEPGARWQYGTSTDIIGRVVERISGLNLEEYFQANIFRPLGMNDTTYFPPPSSHSRILPKATRLPNGTYKEEYLPVPAKITPGGGGGLFSTASDYVKFMRIFLNGGQGILKESSLAAMRQNQIGKLNVRTMVTQAPAVTKNFGFHIEAGDKFGLGFQINPVPYENGRAANSMAWAGFWNTFFWIDPASNLCAVILMQTGPFFDAPSIATLEAFEKAVYGAPR